MIAQRVYSDRAWRCPHRFDYDRLNFAEAHALRKWCRDTYGSDSHEGRWEHQSMSSGPWGLGGWIGFRDLSDAMVFKMRWC